MQTEFQAETSNEGSEIQIEASDWRDGGLKHRDGLKRCWPLKFMFQAKFLRFPGACRGGEERVLEERVAVSLSRSIAVAMQPPLTYA